jgi:thiol-disulfide isomerase/thioredoxin
MNQYTNVYVGGRRHCTGSWPALMVAISSLGAAFLANPLAADEPQTQAPMAPQLVGISHWLNSDRLTLESQRGKVVVVHFWTFGCINCQHNLPYYNGWRHDFSEKEVQIIGIHTPETTDEADEKQVASHINQFGIQYPVAVDGGRATWEAYNNRYWPSIYLIDKQGRIRYH